MGVDWSLFVANLLNMVLIVSLGYCYICEAKLITLGAFSRSLYRQFTWAAIVMLVLWFEGIRNLPDYEYALYNINVNPMLFKLGYILGWGVALCYAGAIGYVLYSKALPKIETIKPTQRLVVAILVGLLCGWLALYSNTVALAILLVLLGLWSGYRVDFVVGILLFLFGISKMYYDLDITLLTKSIMLMSSGAVFLVIYYFVNKKLKSDEKI